MNSRDAIHSAVIANDLSILRRAIGRGEDVNQLDREGRSPIFYAAGEGKMEVLKELIKAGAKVDLPDRDLKTPLHFAAMSLQLEAASFLIENGAFVDVCDAHGNTPLSDAVFESRGRGEMIRLLLSNGADKHLKNRHNVSPQDLANSIANFDISKFLE